MNPESPPPPSGRAPPPRAHGEEAQSGHETGNLSKEASNGGNRTVGAGAINDRNGCAPAGTIMDAELKERLKRESREAGLPTETVGLGIAYLSMWMLWISPDPEPAAAWTGIVAMGISGALVSVSRHRYGRLWGQPTSVAAGIGAATLILRASIGRFP